MLWIVDKVITTKENISCEENMTLKIIVSQADHQVRINQTIVLDTGAVMAAEEASAEGLGAKILTPATSLILFSCSVPWIVYSSY